MEAHESQTSIDEAFMQAALHEAQLAARSGDVPVGAVVVSPEGTILGVGRNRREVDMDPTAHAEIVAMRAAAVALRMWRLIDCTLYVTLEPCTMCAGAMVNARIGRLVYGCTDPKAGAIVSRFAIGTDDRLNHRFTVVSGVLAEASVQALRAFFAALRAAGEK